MNYLGDFQRGQTVRVAWNSNTATGGSVTRATNGTVSVYKDGNTTQTTVGVSDTEDFDAVTGIHEVAIDTSADTFYVPGSDYKVVLSGATIDGQTVNAVLAQFSLQNRYVPGLIYRGFAQAGGTTSQIIFPAAASFSNDLLVGSQVVVAAGTGYGNSRFIDDMTADTAEVSPVLSGALDATSYLEVFGIAPASEAAVNTPPVNVTHWNGTAVPAEHTAGYPVITIKDGTGTGELNTDAGVVMAKDQSGASLATLAGQTTTTSTLSTINTKLGTPTGASMSADIAGVSTASAASIRAEMDANSTKLASINAKTAQLTFTKTNEVDANNRSVDSTTIVGSGTDDDPWRPE